MEEEEEGFDESDVTLTDEVPLVEKPSVLMRIAERATNAHLNFGWQVFEYGVPSGAELVEWTIDLDLPDSDGGVRTISIDERRAPSLLDSTFESWIFLAKYVAVLDTSSGTIEAALRTVGTSTSGASLQSIISRMHRYAAKTDSSTEHREASPDPDTLRLDTQSTSLESMEFSRLTPGLKAAARYGTNRHSLKVKPRKLIASAAAVRLLRDLSTSAFFEIDTTYGVALALKEFKNQRIRIVRNSGFPLRLLAAPKHKYGSEATSLYFYGRSASDMPLLQFLAFYQVLEFFFPTYARTETIRNYSGRLSSAVRVC